MVLAAIKQFTGGDTAQQSPLPFPDFDPPIRLVKSPTVKSAPASPMAFYFDGSNLQALKYRDGETHTSFGAWMAPGSGYREFGANENGYANAYMSCVWAFRAINVLVQKVAEILRRGEVVNKQTGEPVHDHLFNKALDLAYTFYQQDVYEDWLLSKALYGETYVELVSAFPIPYSVGVPRTVRVLNALGVEPIIQRGMIAGYTYDGDDGKEQFAPDDVAFDKYHNPLDDVRGLSLLTSALDAVNIDRSLVIFTRFHLKNNARPGLIFTPKEGRLSAADVDLIQTTLSEDVKGAQNAGNPLLMPTAFDVTTAQAPSMEDLLGTTGDQVKRRICSAVGVPVALVDYTDMAFQLSPEQKANFYELTVIPNAEKVARVINAQILPFFDPTRKSEFKLPIENVRASLADPKARTEIADMRLRAGAITLNEYREMLDMKPTADGAVRFVPMGVQIVKEGLLGQTPAPLPQTPPAPLLGAGNGNVEPAQPPAAQAVDVPPTVTKTAKFDPSQPRDDQGQWTGSGGSFRQLTTDDEVAAFAKPHNETINNLPENERKALQDYAASDYWTVNGALRGGEAAARVERYTGVTPDLNDPATAQRISALDNALSKSRLEESVTSYRAISAEGVNNLFGDVSADSLIGVEVRDPGFLSTSMLSGATDRFNGEGGARFEIRNPAGSNALLLGGTAAVSDERELLLPRGTRLRITDVQRARNESRWGGYDYWQIVAEVVS